MKLNIQQKMKKTFFLLWLIGGLFLNFSRTAAQTEVIAHRGYWNCEGSAQNSLTALSKAAEAGVYGSEFDVLITADGVPVVNHDDSIQGLCIETSLYSQLKELKLENGEFLPTLDQYLAKGKAMEGIQLILEIKAHRRIVNEDRAVATILNLVDTYGLEDRVEYISFSLNVCKELIRRAPSAQVSYLRGEICPADLKKLGFSGLDYHYTVLDQHPDWIEKAHALGLTVNVWTANDPALIQSLIDRKVDFITTDDPLKAKEMVEK